MSDLEELKRLAQAATPGPWETREHLGYGEAYCEWHQVGPFDLQGAEARADSKFIAAANPAAVLALIERVEELEKCAADVKAEFDRGEWVTGAGYREQVARAERAESERDAYKEHSELLEGWSKATTKALTGEEAPELRMAWTCEVARGMREQIDAASLSLNRQPGESLEQAAERAMDEVAGLLERRAALETFARNFSEAVDGDLRAIEQSRKGGMQVALTGDFVSAPPSVQSRLRWWAERAKEALKEGK